MLRGWVAAVKLPEVVGAAMGKPLRRDRNSRRAGTSIRLCFKAFGLRLPVHESFMAFDASTVPVLDLWELLVAFGALQVDADQRIPADDVGQP